MEIFLGSLGAVFDEKKGLLVDQLVIQLDSQKIHSLSRIYREKSVNGSFKIFLFVVGIDGKFPCVAGDGGGGEEGSAGGPAGQGDEQQQHPLPPVQSSSLTYQQVHKYLSCQKAFGGGGAQMRGIAETTM